MNKQYFEMKVIKPSNGECLDIELEYDVLKRNKEIADKNRKLFMKYGIKVIDIMGGVGTGKTSLIEKAAKYLKGKTKIGVIAGDLETTIDADRVSKYVSQVIQINTGKECHLDANLVMKALKKFNLKELDMIFIENVGNIICPSEFPVGAEKRVVVISVPEGPYIIRKHPHVFYDISACVINKIDLEKIMQINVDDIKSDLRNISPCIDIFEVSCKTGRGVEKFVKFLYA